jgi:tryptophan synthase alpha chain
MSRLTKLFEDYRAGGKKTLIPYVCAGDPSPAQTVSILRSLVRAGASAIEVGMPFSDPMADGRTIQQASERAIAQGVGLKQVFDMVAEFRSTDDVTPIVLMGYANTVEHWGVEAFADKCVECGVDGVLVVDYPPHESKELCALLRQRGIDMIYLLAPTSTLERIQEVAHCASGYIYYVSVTGVTGTKAVNVESVFDKLPEIRKYTDLPIAVGFGIRDAETAAKLAQKADGVIIGSRLIQIMHETEGDPASAAEVWIRGVRNALDASVG